jgi:hypothetical protein
LILIAVLASAGVGYRLFLDEQTLSTSEKSARAHDKTAEQALASMEAFRAAIHAYVAPGQTSATWTKRASDALDAVRDRLTSLEPAVSAVGGSLTNPLNDLDQLAASDKRARGFVESGQDLLAGDLIFNEMHEILDGAVKAVVTARTEIAQSSDRAAAGIRREQASLALAVLAVWLVIAAVLVPTPAPVAEQPDWRHKLAERLKTPKENETLNLHLAPVEPVIAQPSAASAELETVAAVCADLSALTNIAALPGALSRASDVLGAKGLIVWIASNDASHLSPVAIHGYDPQLLSRIGSVPRDSSNITSTAFREGSPRLSVARDATPAALAVPMCGPSGPVGVLSAEMQPGRNADPTCVALATIFAAQLATLAMPVPNSQAESPAVAPGGREGGEVGLKQAQA